MLHTYVSLIHTWKKPMRKEWETYGKGKREWLQFRGKSKCFWAWRRVAIWLKLSHVVRRSTLVLYIYIYKTIQGSTSIPKSNQTKTKVEQHECSISIRKGWWCYSFKPFWFWIVIMRVRWKRMVSNSPLKSKQIDSTRV